MLALSLSSKYKSSFDTLKLKTAGKMMKIRMIGLILLMSLPPGTTSIINIVDDQGEIYDSKLLEQYLPSLPFEQR